MEEKATPHSDDAYTMGEMKTDMAWIKKILGNHLQHHQRYEAALIVGVTMLAVKALFF